MLDLAEHGAQEEEVRVAAALRWLRDHPGWFLILDNVDTEAAVGAVEQLLARLHGGQVLITSRLSRFSDVVEPLELDVLSPEDGAEFLLEKTKPDGRRGRKRVDGDEVDALVLADTLGGLALAMEQAGANIIQMRRSFAEYTELWCSHEANMDKWHNRTIQYAGPSDSSGKAPQRTVAITWHATLDELGQSERDLLNQLAWFAPDPVPLSVFASEDATHTVGETDFRECIANLADFSMLQWDIESEAVTVHRVVQEILRNQQEKPTDELKGVLQLLHAGTPEGNPLDVRTWSAWESLRSHVAFVTEKADDRGIEVPTSDLMGKLGALYYAMALYSDAEHLERRALAIDENHYGKESVEAATRLNNLAQTLKATNRLEEAESLMRRSLSIGKASYGEDHPSVAIRLNNLAQLLKATNRLEEAEPVSWRVVEILFAFGKNTGHEHPDMQVASINYIRLRQEMGSVSYTHLTLPTTPYV